MRRAQLQQYPLKVTEGPHVITDAAGPTSCEGCQWFDPDSNPKRTTCGRWHCGVGQVVRIGGRCGPDRAFYQVSPMAKPTRSPF